MEERVYYLYWVFNPEKEMDIQVNGKLYCRAQKMYGKNHQLIMTGTNEQLWKFIKAIKPMQRSRRGYRVKDTSKMKIAQPIQKYNKTSLAITSAYMQAVRSLNKNY